MDGLQAAFLHRLVIDAFKKFRIDHIRQICADPATVTLRRLAELEEIWRQTQGRFAAFFSSIWWIFQDG